MRRIGASFFVTTWRSESDAAAVRVVFHVSQKTQLYWSTSVQNYVRSSLHRDAQHQRFDGAGPAHCYFVDNPV